MESTISAMLEHLQQNRFTEDQGGREINIPVSSIVSKNISDILSLNIQCKFRSSSFFTKVVLADYLEVCARV